MGAEKAWLEPRHRGQEVLFENAGAVRYVRHKSKEDFARAHQ